ncbi:MAG: hypothetical protein WCJ30_21025, partial [Deltaproteobacteria bacterium]
MADGTTRSETERIAREMLAIVRATLTTASPGQLVSIAVFDHSFGSKPVRPPLVVVTWKDWRGDRVDVMHVARAQPVPPPVDVDIPIDVDVVVDVDVDVGVVVDVDVGVAVDVGVGIAVDVGVN